MRTQTQSRRNRMTRAKSSRSERGISFGDYAHLAIGKHFKKSTKYEKDVLKDQDPEPLHQMRVGMRRLRTALLVFAPAISLPEAASRQQITKIAKQLGRVRDLDVMQIWFNNYLSNTKLSRAEAQQVEQILTSLQKRRDKQFARMQATLQGKRYSKFVDSFQTWLDQPTYQSIASLPILDVLPDILLPLITQLLLHPGWLVGTTVEDGQHRPTKTISSVSLKEYLEQEDAPIHDLRKQIKGVRYQTEFFVEFYDQTFRTQTREFRTIQDTLGTLQDGVVLSAFLAGELGEYWQQMVPTLVEHLQNQRLQLWQQWQSKQQQYLDPEFRQSLRSQVLTPEYRSESGGV